MTTTTQITNIGDKLDLRPYAAEFAGDYDMDAIHGQYVALVNDGLPHGIGVCSNGDVIATTDVADQARDIDWTETLDSIDVAPLFN